VVAELASAELPGSQREGKPGQRPSSPGQACAALLQSGPPALPDFCGLLASLRLTWVLLLALICLWALTPTSAIVATVK
jgi:hypothetical protein